MSDILVRNLGYQPYQPTWHAMRSFTEQRGPETVDELWIVEHPPVYTLGLNGKTEHLLAPGEIPVVAIDRGGQVTYHGPGQLVIYLLINVKRQNWGVRRLVTAIEQAVIGLLADYGVEAKARVDAPGVYVAEAKVAALGLRVRRGCSYHGLSLNVAMELSPFQGINPCGYPGMAVTQLQDLGISDDLTTVADKLVRKLCDELGFEPQLSPVTDSNQVL